MAREAVDDGEFLEVFVDAPHAVAEAGDEKGLDAKARNGELVIFTGIDSPYEALESPDIQMSKTQLTAEAAVRCAHRAPPRDRDH